jgi:hypothetical protein
MGIFLRMRQLEGMTGVRISDGALTELEIVSAYQNFEAKHLS